jgi:uncharacterized protein YutE (UPF0331/DUF86 family)
MGSDVILKKMDSLRRCLSRLEEKTPEDFKSLKENHDLQDIVSINLERAVQLSVDIGLQLLTYRNKRPPDSMAEVFADLAAEGIISSSLADHLKSAVGFRKIAVHEYEEIDWNIVHSILTDHLGDFYSYMKRVLEYWESF